MNPVTFLLAALLSTTAQAAEYMEKTPLSVIAGVFARCHHVWWNHCVGGWSDCDPR